MNNIPDFRLNMAGTDLRGTLFDEALQLLDITDRVRPRLVSLSLSEKRGEEADQLDIVLDDTDGKLELPTTGATLQLQIGWKQGRDVITGLVNKGRFIVDEVSHSGPPDRVTIRARAADFASEIKTRREKSYHGTTLGAIVSEIAGRNKLRPRCAAQLAGIAVTSKIQSRESDLAFLRRIGREHSAVAKIAAGTLILAPIGTGRTASGKVLPTVTILRREGDSHEFTRQKRDDVPGVAATYHDRKAGKRRAIVPICPTLAPWLDGVTGKVIRYRTPTSAKTRAAGGPEWFERPTANIANGFEGVLLAAHAARPNLGLARQAVDADGKPVWLEPRKKLGETKRRPKMVSIGSPNTLRHTIHTWHKRHGVPEAQIDAAAGHSEQGTGASYTHLRPEYLREFMSSTEAFWEAVGEFTDAHLRYQRDTNVVVLTGARVRRTA